MTMSSRCGTGDLPPTNLFSLKCSVCGRVYLQLHLAPEMEAAMATQELTMPILPCHAESLIVEGEEEKGFDRVVRLLTDGPTKSNGAKFMYTLNMVDGMISGFSVMRG